MKTFWKNFSEKELSCSCCGKSNPNPEFQVLMEQIQILRDTYRKPMVVSSAYRCEKHRIEAKKSKGGQHTIAAIDLEVSKQEAFDLLHLAMEMDVFDGIGINQKGEGRFLHLDMRGFDNRTIWSY